MSDSMSVKRSSLYYFPRVRNFGFIKQIKDGVIQLISPFYKEKKLTTVAIVDVKEDRMIMSYLSNDEITLVDGQLLNNTTSGETYICNVLPNKSFKIRKIKTKENFDFYDIAKMIKEEESGDISRIETIYNYRGDFEKDFTTDKIISIFAMIGGGTGNIELGENIYQLIK